MPDDFAALLDATDGLVAGVLNSHPSTRSLLAAAVVRQLSNLAPEIIPFMEKSGSFLTVLDKASYGHGDAGFPKGLLRFERLFYDLGTTIRPIDPVDPDTVRAYQERPSQAYPSRACWYEERLQFGPAPAGAYTVKWDVILDATKDSVSGTTITVTDGAATNPWFTTGKVALRHLAWADYFMTSPDQRPEMASAHGNSAQIALERLREAGKKRQAMNAVVCTPNAFDNYRASPSARLQTIFPGAR